MQNDFFFLQVAIYSISVKGNFHHLQKVLTSVRNLLYPLTLIKLSVPQGSYKLVCDFSLKLLVASVFMIVVFLLML